MAEGYLKAFAGPLAEVFSAGIEAHGLNPRAIASMKEDGIDISYHTSNSVEEYSHIDFDFVITVCDNANEHCPVFPSNAQKVHHNFPDPSKAKGSEEEIMRQFSSVRDDMRRYFKEFVRTYLTIIIKNFNTNSK